MKLSFFAAAARGSRCGNQTLRSVVPSVGRAAVRVIVGGQVKLSRFGIRVEISNK